MYTPKWGSTETEGSSKGGEKGESNPGRDWVPDMGNKTTNKKSDLAELEGEIMRKERRPGNEEASSEKIK